MKYTSGKYIDQCHIEVMGYGKDAYKDASLYSDGSDQYRNGKNGLPVAELHDGIAGIEQVIGNQDNIIGSICLCCVVVKKS